MPNPVPAGNGPPNLTLVPNTGSNLPSSNPNNENSSSSWLKPVLSRLGAVLMLIQIEGGRGETNIESKIRANLDEDQKKDDRQLFLFRVGGGAPSNLKLKPRERDLNPPGISFLAGFDAKSVALQFKAVMLARGQIKAAAQATIMGRIPIQSAFKHGFTPMVNPTAAFPNHIRLTHRMGVEGFSNLLNRQKLSQEFTNIPTGL